MKYIVSEHQYKLLIEQLDSRMPFQPEQFGLKQGKPETVRPAVEKQKEFFKSIDPHTAALILGIATAFIPVVGPFISAGIGLYDAKTYYDEGDTKTAGMVAMFSLLPGVGSLISKIPGIKQLGAKGMAALAPKITKGGSQLTKLESEVVQGISENSALIQQELNTYVKNLAAQGAKTATNPTTAQTLATFAKQGVKGLTRAATPYVAAGVTYSKGYDELQKNTPKSKAQGEGLDWNFVRTSFGSSGSEQDNIMLSKAWDKGWRPGTVVPTEFQTKQYIAQYNQEVENLKQLEALLAQVGG
jgi:hypothetical protein